MSISKVCPHKFVIGFHMRIKFIVLWKTIFIIQYASASCFALKYGIALCRNPSGESSQNKFIKVLNSWNLIFFRRSSIYCLQKTLNEFPRVLFNHNNVGHYLVCKKTFRPSEIMLKPGSPLLLALRFFYGLLLSFSFARCYLNAEQQEAWTKNRKT